MYTKRFTVSGNTHVSDRWSMAPNTCYHTYVGHLLLLRVVMLRTIVKSLTLTATYEVIYVQEDL